MSFTKAENELIDFLENDFIYELDDYESPESILILKTTNNMNVRRDFIEFIKNILAQKPDASLRDENFKKNYRIALEEAKKKARDVLLHNPDMFQNSQHKNFINEPNFLASSRLILSPVDQAEHENKLKEVSLKRIDSGAVEISNNIYCVIKYRKIKMKDLKGKKLIWNFINTFTGVEITLPYDDMSKHSLVDEINVHDEMGDWHYDHLQSCMKIYFKMSQGPLPQKFYIKKNFFFDNPKNVQFVKKFKANSTENVNSLTNLTLEKFLESVIKINKKPYKYVELWKESLKKEHVEKLEEILAWNEKDWDNSHIEVNAKKLMQEQLYRIKYNSNFKNTSSFSKAEKYAITHRIKRFLVWKTDPKELLNIPYLDYRALEEGFKEIRKEYTGDYLLEQFKDFYDSYAIPISHSKSLMFSRGMLLYGPPGTGKTSLTEKLPSKIGLTQISSPICASQVNKSLVGQTENLLMELTNRARQIPYLLCCLAVDEIDSLAPKRDEKSSQHKVDALAVLLSVIGGIKDVPNLFFVASTNRLNQMDDAFKRRSSGQFFVGMPSPMARKSIISDSEGTFLDEEMIDQAVMMTTNFSGAALKQFISDIVTEVCKLNANPKDLKPVTLSYAKLAEIAARMSKQFNIRLGNQSLPELFALQKQNEKLMNLSFLKTLNDNKAIVIFRENYLEVRYKRERVVSTAGFKFEHIEEIDKRKIIIESDEIEAKNKKHLVYNKLIIPNPKKNPAQDSIHAYYLSLLDVKTSVSETNVINYLQKKINHFKAEAKENQDKTYVIIWDDPFQAIEDSDLSSLSDLEKNEILSFIATYFNQSINLENLYNLFSTNEFTYKKFIKFTDWGSMKPFNKKKLNFTGRILVDLNEEDQEIRFQLNEKGDKYQLHNEPLFLEKRAVNSFEVLPKLVEFAFERGVDFILLMDQDFLLSRNAFDESKIKENVTEKMQEFNCYEKSLLIIDVDSMVGMVRSVSESSMGISTSYNLSDPKLYSLIIHYAKSLPKILSKSEYWVALITKNQELTNMIKKDLSWPKSVKELEEDEEMEKLQEEVRCVRCDELYIEAKNELTSCHYHDGDLFELSNPSYSWKKLNVEEAKKLYVKSKIFQANQNKDPQFLYLCCLEPLRSQGCKKGRHISNLITWEVEKADKIREYDEKFNELKKEVSP